MRPEKDTANQRFREAFKRLKAGDPIVLPKGTPVSQNNVAKEAGTDPSALRKSRYPALIREIQAWLEINKSQDELKQERVKRQKEARRDSATVIEDLTKQRDEAQSALVSAHMRILELLEENAALQTALDDLREPPTPLRKSRKEKPG